MAGPPKKKALQENDENVASSDDDSGSEEYTGQQEIQADFEGRNPEGEDFHGIKKLLQQLFLKAHIDLSQMSDMLIAQAGIGSVLKQSFCDDDEDDEDDEMNGGALEVFGITSIINMYKHKESTCVKQMNTVVISQAMQHSDKNTQDQVKEIMANSKVGFLVNERFLNIPPKISDPLLTSLMAELDRYKRKDDSYDFDYFLVVCKMHKPKGGGDDFVYANAEEEIFVNEASIQFEFSVENESDTSVAGKWKEDDVEMIPYRKVVLFKGSKFMNIVQQIKQFVN
ncbi:PREDICTED: protein BCCIP homolog [Nicrophorus vespilloides]|uniref:Protein BCCIP homolog n=1 Tax=Nicrophorus vespilloides TaxID=110193 RepID=A0ABM1MB08_NICVS|nr:PREDICTED: protein BCCIP homolog [Nicrophorus vespilloides]